MRKIFAAVVALVLVSALAWGWLQSQRKFYPYPSVAAELKLIASSSGANLTDERTVSASLRGSRVGLLDSLSRKISGRPALDDLEEYTFQSGPDTIHVTIYHSLGKVGSVEIHPGSKLSKLAAALESGLAASFPKIDCDLIRP
jgi:hypothetical protein